MAHCTIDIKVVEKIARTAALELDEEMMLEIVSDLKKIAVLFEAMDKIEICPTKLSDFNKINCEDLRDDNTQDADTKADKCCYRYHDAETGYFTVPEVLNNEK